MREKCEAIPVQDVGQEGEVFYTVDVDIPAGLPAGGRYYFSSSPDMAAGVVVDDGLFVLLNGEVDFSYDFSTEHSVPTPVVIEVPREKVAAWSGQTIRVEYRDLYGVSVHASDIWLIWVP